MLYFLVVVFVKGTGTVPEFLFLYLLGTGPGTKFFVPVQYRNRNRNVQKIR